MARTAWVFLLAFLVPQPALFGLGDAGAVPPLPNVAFVPLVARGAVRVEQRHQGSLVALALELACLQSARVNVVTQGVQAEIWDDLFLSPNTALSAEQARKLAQLSGASWVLYGTFEPGPFPVMTYKVRIYEVLTGVSKDLVTVIGPPQDNLLRIMEAVARELGMLNLALPWIPTAEKAQRAWVMCQSWASLALERGPIRGRKVTPAKAPWNACKEATAGAPGTHGAATVLAARVLAGDLGAVPELAREVDVSPRDRLPALVLFRNHLDAGKLEDAGALLQRITAWRGRDPEVLRLAAALEFQKDNAAGAHAGLTAAEHEAPQSAYVSYRLSMVSYPNRTAQGSVEHAQEALRRAGGDAPFYLLNLGERLLDAGQPQEAVVPLEKCVKQAPSRLSPYVRLGEAHLVQGDAAAALGILAQAQKLIATAREKERGMDVLLKLDLARACALSGMHQDALHQLKDLEKVGRLEKRDTQNVEFDALRSMPEFKRLKAR